MFLMGIGWYYTESKIPLEPWKQAGAYLDQTTKPDDIIIFYPEYIEGITRYYQEGEDDLVFERIEAGSLKDEITQIISKQVRSSKSKNKKFLYLVIRRDNSFKLKTYNILKSYLALNSKTIKK